MKLKIGILSLGILMISGNLVVQSQSFEDGGGNTVDCYSQSRKVQDFDYYDCGTCEKESGRMGFGNALQCTTWFLLN